MRKGGLGGSAERLGENSMETSREMGGGRNEGAGTEGRRAVGGSIDIVRAMRAGWVLGGSEKGERRDVSGRGMGMVLLEEV